MIEQNVKFALIRSEITIQQIDRYIFSLPLKNNSSSTCEVQKEYNRNFEINWKVSFEDIEFVTFQAVVNFKVSASENHKSKFTTE